MKKFFIFTVPILLLIPAYPSISLAIFRFREPTFESPLALAGPLQIRKDPYGSGYFGARRNGGRRHRGVDLLAPVGTPVVAAKSGRASLGRTKNGMGRYVEVRHPDGWMTRYGHLKEIRIRDRQRVRRGRLLGTVGKTGNAKRRIIQPHLHFEVIDPRGKFVDPLGLIGTATSDK